MKKFWSKVLMLTCVVIVCSVGFASAEVTLNAGDATIVKNIVNTEKIGSLKGNDPITGNEKTFAIFKVNGNKFTFDAENMKYVTKKEKERSIEALIGGLNKNTAISKEGRNYVFGEIRENADNDTLALAIPLIFNDTQADIFTALQIVEPFKSPFTIVLGVGVVILITCIVISTLVDMAYIGIPWCRSFADSKAENNGKQKVMWVSNAAYSSVQTCESDSKDGYKETYFVYLKRRAVTLILLSLCVMYLLLGAIAPFISWLLNLTAGISGRI